MGLLFFGLQAEDRVHFSGTAEAHGFWRREGSQQVFIIIHLLVRHRIKSHGRHGFRRSLIPLGDQAEVRVTGLRKLDPGTGHLVLQTLGNLRHILGFNILSIMEDIALFRVMPGHGAAIIR